jgi:multiple antibiotic resistance protein
MITLFIHTFIKFFFLLTPFFLLSTFLSMTRDMNYHMRKKIAFKVTFSLVIISIILLLLGNQIFMIFGITLNSFRIGTGILLFLSAKDLVQGSDIPEAEDPAQDIAVVPLAIPVAIGPATTGALLVMGGDLPDFLHRVTGISAVLTAIVCVGLLLYISGYIEKILKKRGLVILSKITGLVLAALAAEMVMTGIGGFMK